MEKLTSELYDKCFEFTRARIETAQSALTQAREAANGDTKSSAGDKFETSREMMQQEIDRNKRLLIDAEEQQNLLNRAHSVTPSDRAQHGSVVFTSQGNFYLSISAGQITVGKDVFYAVSPSSPIGQLLMGKKSGDKFALNQREYVIKKVA